MCCGSSPGGWDVHTVSICCIPQGIVNRHKPRSRLGALVPGPLQAGVDEVHGISFDLCGLPGLLVVYHA